MIARKADLAQIFPDCLRVIRILLRDDRKTGNSIHRRADIVGHRGQEIRFRPIRGIGLFRRQLQLFIESAHIRGIQNQNCQKSCKDHTDQAPIHGSRPNILYGDVAQQAPVFGRTDRRMCDQTGLSPGVVHEKGAAFLQHGTGQAVQCLLIRRVIRFVKLEETAVFKGVSLDDIAAGSIDHGKLRILIFLLRKDPFGTQFRDRNDADHHAFSRQPCIRVNESEFIIEPDGLYAAHRAGIRSGNVDGFSHRADLREIREKIEILIRHPEIVVASRPRPGREPFHAAVIRVENMRSRMYGNVRRPDKTDSLLQRHVVRGDIMGPDIADALLTL